MKLSHLILIGIIFSSSCSSSKQDFDSIEIISYNYIMNNELFEQRCYLYALINSDGNARFYQWKKHFSNEAIFSEAKIEESLIDSIIVAAERQKENLSKIKSTISLYDGPLLIIKMNHHDKSFELIDFELENVLFKYLEALYDKNRLESNDSIEINRKKLELQNLVWKKDSSFYKGEMPHPIIPNK